MRRFGLGLIAAIVCLLPLAPAAHAVGEQMEPKEVEWPHHGPFGTYDRAALQRGFLVYQQVCSTCHALQYMAFRNLEQIGLTEDEVKVIAAGYQVTDGPDDSGETFERPGRPSDPFPAPYPNENAARAANGGAAPPNLSLIVKAREGHEDYVYSLLTGYTEPPADVEVRPGLYFNPYFPGEQLAMPPPLSEGIVTYPDGTEATVEQMAHDVTSFLAWAGEPMLEERKQLGVEVVLFLVLFAGLMYAVKRKVWAAVH